MIKHDVIDVAIELHLEKEGNAPPPRLAEEFFDSLYSEWVDNSKPRLVQIAGTLRTTTQIIPVPGYRQWVYVEVGDTPVGSVPQDAMYYNELENYETNLFGFVVQDEQLKFTSGWDGEIAIGDSYKIIYYSDALTLSDTMQLFVPDKVHLMVALELQFRFREYFGGKPLTGPDILARRKNERKFKATVGGRTTQSNNLIQPNGIYNMGANTGSSHGILTEASS